jgi:hypothetical protein
MLLIYARVNNQIREQGDDCLHSHKNIAVPEVSTERERLAGLGSAQG